MINKIVFTTLEAMVEFSGKKLKPKRLSITPLTYVNKGQGIFSLDVSKYLQLQVTLNSRYAKIVIRYSFYRIFAERRESRISRNENRSLCNSRCISHCSGRDSVFEARLTTTRRFLFTLKSGMQLICNNIWTACYKFSKLQFSSKIHKFV